MGRKSHLLLVIVSGCQAGTPERCSVPDSELHIKQQTIAIAKFKEYK